MSGRDKKPSKPSSSSNRPGGIRTLSDLNRPSAHDSDSDEAPQEYYTGGEKSGMIVQDPTNRNNVDAIFEQVRQLGATQGLPETLQPASSSGSFTGAGRLLSGETAPVVAPAASQQPAAIVHNIVFWRNGFTVNDGPFRRLDDPENRPFIESITKSECPKELEPADRRTPIEVKLIRREGDYTEPERSTVQAAFQGVGRTLGISTPTEPEASTVPAPLHSAPAPSIGLVVDSSQPSTSIQLRLSDGTRMVARFNHHHTIAHIRGFIDASRPGGARSYQLQAVGFPPKILTDPTQTIEEAGLLNSVVIQKG